MWPEKAKDRAKTGLPLGQEATATATASHSHIALAMAMQIRYLDLDGHLLGGRATKIKTKQRFPIKATTWPKGDWTLAAWAIRAP